jgi:hypothetical protein
MKAKLLKELFENTTEMYHHTQFSSQQSKKSLKGPATAPYLPSLNTYTLKVVFNNKCW